ncbi:MAG: hypothetical protein MK110_13125 [Fuerstiella sp.]|nr:hypothetical protein [Fuerstiella sp.]
MTSSLVAGLDIGTTSISIVVLSETGKQVSAVNRPHKAGLKGLPRGYAEQNPMVLWRTVVNALQRITQELAGGLVRAVGLTGQMHSTLLLREDGEPAANIITWQDKRAAVREQSEYSILDKMLLGITPESMEPAGCSLAPGYMGTTLFAMQQLNQLPVNFHRVSFVADWIGGRLAGQRPVTDRSHAASSGLYDLCRDCWSDELMAATATRPAWLPRVMNSGSVIGQVSPETANETGLPAGIAVCNAVGDNQAAVLSSLPRTPDSLLINIGTGGQIVWRIPDFQRVEGMDTRYLPSGPRDNKQSEHEFMLVGAGLCGGDEIAWINRTVQQWLSAFDVHKTEEEIWLGLTQQLSEMSDEPHRLTCEPFFSGTRPEPSRRAVFRNVAANNFTPAHVARSILNGIVESMFHVYETAARNSPDVLKRIAVSGNGARQNPRLVQAVEERFQTATKVAPCREEAATGAAMLAGVHTDIWPDLQTAQQKIHREALAPKSS